MALPAGGTGGRVDLIVEMITHPRTTRTPTAANRNRRSFFKKYSWLACS